MNTIVKRLIVVAIFFLVEQLQNTVTRNFHLKVYFGFVCRTMAYDILVWGNSPEAARIFLLQKKPS